MRIQSPFVSVTSAETSVAASAARSRRQVVDDEEAHLARHHVVEPLTRLRHDEGLVVPALALVAEPCDLLLLCGDGGAKLCDLLPLLRERRDRRREHDDGEHEYAHHDERETGESDAAEPARAATSTGRVVRDSGAARAASREPKFARHARSPGSPGDGVHGRNRRSFIAGPEDQRVPPATPVAPLRDHAVKRGNAVRPAYTAASPSSSSILRS